MSHTEINLSSLKYNFTMVKKSIGFADSKIFCVVKSDAYGCGLKKIAQCLQSCGADGFVVADLKEGISLRSSGIKIPVLVLGFTPPSKVSALKKYDLSQSVFSREYFCRLTEESRRTTQTGKLKIWLKLNCGFNRLGISYEELAANQSLYFDERSGAKVVGIFAHLSAGGAIEGAAKNATDSQIACFEGIRRLITSRGNGFEYLFSLANSAKAMATGDPYGCARVGAALYGIGSFGNTKPIKSVYARVLQINFLKAGQAVGYDAKFIAEKQCSVAVLDVGYADGLTRSISNAAQVFLRGEYCKLIGNICMNHCFALLNDDQKAYVGDYAELIGQHISAQQLAKQSRTIDYEIYCRLNGSKTVYVL